MGEIAVAKETGAQPGAVEVDFRAIDDLIFTRFNGDKENIIMILQALNKEYNWLPEPVLNYVSTRLDIPLSQMYGVATFYSMFSLEPRGRHLICLCTGTACHVRGGQIIKERLEAHLGIKPGKTTEDMRFTFETVRCIGCCSIGPVAKIDEKVYRHTDSAEILKALEGYT